MAKMDRVKGGKDIDEYIANQKPRYRPVLQALRKLINGGAPELKEKIMWGNPTFVRGKEKVVFLYVMGDHVNLGFFRGIELKDPGGTLEGTGKGMRHIKVWKVEDIREREFTGLVKQALTLNPD